ncbi:MAG: AraC family transcriptional regulator [Pseudomonadales bacterium]|nr:AraC family transcriptional regulator [Pseudomonadales bacterium]
MINEHPHATFFTSDRRSIFIGSVENKLKRSNVAATLVVSLTSELEVRSTLNDESIYCKSILVPAGTTVTINTQSAPIAQFFLDDLGMDFAKLAPQMSHAFQVSKSAIVYHQVINESQLIACALTMFYQRPNNQDAIALFDRWIDLFPSNADYNYDHRVEAAIQLIKRSYKENLSVEEVAASVGLSVPRLSQLFKQVTGIPIRRFRLWYRIFATAEKLSLGFSLTDAALDSGFSDYSQMCRVFKELTGSKPSAVKRSVELRPMAA